MSGSMDKLVEAVARAMCAPDVADRPHPDAVLTATKDWPRWKHNEYWAEKAIRAVLTHYSEPGNVTQNQCISAMERHLTVGGAWCDTIAAAMRAALEEMK